MSIPPDQRGPHLAAAFLCERVLKEQDGVTSAIRIVDRLTVGAIGLDAPKEMPLAQIQLKAVVILKSGAARGSYEVKLSIEAPSGVSNDLGEYPVYFGGEEQGVELLVDLNLNLSAQGLYWIDVSFGDELLTRIPLRIVYAPSRPPRGD